MIHLLKLLSLFVIVILEILGLAFAFKKTDDNFIDISELFNYLVNIISEIVCLVLIRKEFSTLKMTSGYVRSYILLSFFVYTIVILVNAFNKK